MNCIRCGHVLPDGARFCAYCGQKIGGKVCPNCGKEAESDQIYCAECGSLLAAAPEEKPVVQQKTTAPVPQGKLMKSLKLVSMYNGTPTIGIAAATGSLYVYDDRIEFSMKMGNAMGSMFGLAGAVIAAKKAKKAGSERIFMFSDLRDVQVGKYGGVYNTLVLRLKNGQVFSLVPGVPGSKEPAEIVQIFTTFTGRS